jgi:NAD dependent epimerase/dehydratase family enzyme
MKLILGEMHILLFNNKNIIPKRAQELGFEFKYPTIEKALNNIIK